jgi:ABC-2 type transport system permease protein
VTALRVALIGGLLSFRGLFSWLHPALFVPTLIVPPLFQVLFFAYLGRAAELETDTFYVVGNSIQLAALPGLFAMSQAIAGERRAQTLVHLLASPASRLALFLGRSLPVMAIGVAVSVASFTFGALVLDVEMSWSSLPLLVLAMATAAFSCTALGVAHAAVALRVRELAVFSNIVFAVLLVFCGVNVPLDDLPGWMSAVAQGLPVTHAVEAGREIAAGATLAEVAGLLATELAIGAAFLVLGLALLRYYEHVARRRATLELV